ncbi:MAG: HAMP domain-containing sensor histidine kinase [Verrucomicrobiota bacterium]
MLSTTRPLRPLPRQMSSLVYHELSTPLATALLYLRIAADRCAGGGAEPARSAVIIAQGEVRRLKGIVDRVVELEREGRPHLRPERIDLGEIVRQTVERSTALISLGSPVTVVVRGSLTALWDEMAVEQIVTNLLSNALKFGAGRPIAVQVRATETGARIAVRDEGCGIPVDEHRRIFDRHVCAPRTEGGGLGLGLWLVRELAVAHGGSVTVSSRLGEGATFQVLLRSLQPEVPVELPPVPLPLPRFARPPVIAARGLRVSPRPAAARERRPGRA